MTRRREPVPVWVAVDDVRVGDIVFHAGRRLEVHRLDPRPGAGLGLVVVAPGRPWDGRRLFYKLGEHVEVLR